MRWLVSLSGLVALGLAGAFLWWPGGDGTAQSCVLAEADIGGFVQVPGGGFVKGADAIYPEEGGPIKLHVSPFLLSVTEVTNDQFAGSDFDGLGRHPVVHVSLTDARAYAAWAGGRLPNEIEWEYAASLGLFDPDDPESGLRGPDGEIRANTWNGIFPVLNTAEDGFIGTAPVGCYRASLIGAYDMIGNVWEWTETPFGDGNPQFTIKGGSYLCGSNYCRRYRAAARESLEPDFSTAHTGFRIVKDPS